MPLILTGVAVYSTTYVDAEGVECRIKLRLGDDAEALGLPPTVLNRLKKLERGRGRFATKYFTHTPTEVVEPAKPAPAPAPKVEPAKGPSISAADLTKKPVEKAEEEPKVEDRPAKKTNTRKKSTSKKAAPKKKTSSTRSSSSKSTAKKTTTQKTSEKKSSKVESSTTKKVEAEKPADEKSVEKESKD